MFLTKDNLSIPNPDPKNGNIYLTYDFTAIMQAEARMDEISFVTPSKAPELLTKFTLSLRDLGNHLADLSYRESVAKRKVRERRAVVVLEVMAGKLAEKKLGNNDTNREAVIDLDLEYSAATDVLNQIEASFILVREKLRSVESAINSTKKVLDTYPNLPNYNLPTQLYGNGSSSFTPEEAASANVSTNIHNHNDTQQIQTQYQTSSSKLLIGKVRY